MPGTRGGEAATATGQCQANHYTDRAATMATASIAHIPAIVLPVAAQRFITTGRTSGAVKNRGVGRP